ncbi:expressed unknown protein [Seminavis robusta]|uniref:Uncharacterized protein n=1 Tax=Seminavis robusta TaxID=568900 RepID=A0A9N8HQC9_9STRA|nr:expressed unknown protein [Seminavis robusta]|eukprot:Sro1182_g249911.1  (200) ;mRNA; r:9737-10336
MQTVMVEKSHASLIRQLFGYIVQLVAELLHDYMSGLGYGSEGIEMVNEASRVHEEASLISTVLAKLFDGNPWNIARQEGFASTFTPIHEGGFLHTCSLQCLFDATNKEMITDRGDVVRRLPIVVAFECFTDRKVGDGGEVICSINCFRMRRISQHTQKLLISKEQGHNRQFPYFWTPAPIGIILEQNIGETAEFVPFCN